MTDEHKRIIQEYLDKVFIPIDDNGEMRIEDFVEWLEDKGYWE